jgi:hypothetical protein
LPPKEYSVNEVERSTSVWKELVGRMESTMTAHIGRSRALAMSSRRAYCRPDKLPTNLSE